MAVPIVLNHNTVYATKGNILKPGNNGETAVSAEADADSRIEDAFADAGITVAGVDITENDE